MKKPKQKPIDGISPKQIEQIRRACRQVWSWSTQRKLVIKRCTDKNGFAVCEKCKKKVPKIFVDHIVNVGDVDDGFIARLFIPSVGLQGLCGKCHGAKTALERSRSRALDKALRDF